MSAVDPAISIASQSRMDRSTTGKHIPALDGVRGCAILLVFTLHFLWGAPYTQHNPILWILNMIRAESWLGVNLFFVLSGFLITGILYDTQTSKHYFRNFYARRALRIFPLYYGSLLLVTMLLLIFHGHWNGMELLKLLTYTRNLFFGSPVPATNLPWIELHHFWTLAIEEQFYLVWPLVVYLAKTRRRIATAALAGILVSILTRIALMHTGIPLITPHVIQAWSPADLDGLCTGALLAIGIRSSWEHRIFSSSLAALLLSLGALLGLSARYPYLGTEYPNGLSHLILPMINLALAATIACSLRTGSFLNRVMSLGVLRFFGKYSYGLYVFHYTFATLSITYRWNFASTLHSRAMSAATAALLGILASIVLALLSFHLYEQPILRLKRYFADNTQTPKLRATIEAQ